MGSGHSKDDAGSTEMLDVAQGLDVPQFHLGKELVASTKEIILDAPQQEPAIFFNRREELLALLKILVDTPRKMTMITGPVDSGKSCLLTQLQHIWQEESSVRKVFAPFLIVNMRERECTTPNGLAEALKRAIEVWGNLVKALMKKLSSAGNVVGVPVGFISSSLALFLNAFKQQQGLVAVQDSIRLYLKDSLNVRPILIFDEANRLKTWERDYPEELESLLHFFIWMTKETRKAHVVMASSDEFFRSWIWRRAHPSRLHVISLGYFSKEDADVFFFEHLLPRYQGLPVVVDIAKLWKSVYEICGGSPYLLETAVGNAVEMGSWEDAVNDIRDKELIRLEDAVSEGGASLQQVNELFQMIIEGHGLAGASAALKRVFPENPDFGKKFIRQLMVGNVIHIRLWTAGLKYKDLAAGVEKGNDREYLMAANPGMFAAMRSFVHLN